MMVTSTDHGASWSDPIRIDSGPGESLQLMPTASIGALDDSTSLIAVHYYDNRSGEVTSSGDYLLDVVSRYEGHLTDHIRRRRAEALSPTRA